MPLSPSDTASAKISCDHVHIHPGFSFHESHMNILSPGISRRITCVCHVGVRETVEAAAHQPGMRLLPEAEVQVRRSAAGMLCVSAVQHAL